MSPFPTGYENQHATNNARSRNGTAVSSSPRAVDRVGEHVDACEAREGMNIGRHSQRVFRRDESRLSSGALDQNSLQRAEFCVRPKKRIEQLIGTLGREGLLNRHS